MVFNATTRDNIPVIQPEGRFDAYQVDDIDTWFEGIITDNPYVIADLHQVTFIDTRALSTLVKWMKKLRDVQGDLKLINLATPVRIIFELSRLDKAFSIYTTLTDALADCGTTSVRENAVEPEEILEQDTNTENLHLITLSKRVDAFSVPELQTKYGDLITAEHPFAIIDLTEVNFLDSAALAWLVKMLKQSQANQGTVVLVRSKIDVANRIFQLTQFDKVFKFVDSVDDAVNLIKR
ncbi:MAG: STAS domain-containing protein [Phototrophicaceae bacterium]